MKTEIPSDVLKQARLLCAISDDPNASTYEIEEALKQAHEILAPYGLTVEEILESLRRDLIEEWYHVPGRQRRTNWICDLMQHIAKFTDTMHMYRTGFRLEFGFVGLFSQVQRAIFHADTLHEQIEYYGECRAPRHMRDIRVYKQGIVDRVAVTMEELRSRVSPAIVEPIVTSIQAAVPERSRLIVLVPAKVDNIGDLAEAGFSLARVDGKMCLIDDLPKSRKTIDIVIDRVTIGLDDDRFKRSLRKALSLAGEVCVENLDTSERLPFQAPISESDPPRPSATVMMKLNHLIFDYIIDQTRGAMRRSTTRSWDAERYNPDYNIGYQHGAEIKIR